MPTIITRQDTRILTPEEYELLRDQLTENSKVHHQTLFDGLLFTGMRNTEYQRFLENPSWYDKTRRAIQLKRAATRKKKVVHVERDVRLSNIGVRTVNNLLNWKLRMPNRASWRDTLLLAARNAGLDQTGINPKMCRKTWESWLLASFPDQITQIVLSQGHTETTAIGHYLSIKFTQDEVNAIRTYTEGWR